MPIDCTFRQPRAAYLATVFALATLIFASGASAQGLDMDATSAPPTAAAGQSGGLDMDVNPATPIRPSQSPKPLQRGAVVDGVAPLTARATPDTPAAPSLPPIDVPASPASLTTEPPAVEAPATTEAAQPAAPAPEPVTLDHPKVIDTARLQDGDKTVTLAGVEGIAGESAAGLQAFLGQEAGHVTCQATAATGFVCLMPDGTNVAQVALVNGAAKTTADAPESYREQEAAAQAARRGIWSNLPPPPETIKHPIVHDTATLASAEGKTYVLDGVVGFQAPYAGQLQGYIAGNGDSVTCSPQALPGHFICLMPDGTDVAKVSLVNGAARVAQDAPDSYRVQQLDAVNNRRGYWLTASDAVMTAALLPPPANDQYVFVAGDDGADGITYVGGAPVAMVEGESVFLVYGDDDLGWGYYDHYHHWHGAPDRFRHHMEHFHPHGYGLRGHDGFRGGHEMAGHPGAYGREMAGHPGAYGHEMGGHPGMAGREMGGREMAGREMAGRGVPGHEMAGHEMGGRPGMPGQMGHPGGMQMAGNMQHPAMAGGGFMRPSPAASMGGFHPAAPAQHMAAAAPHPSGGGGGGKHK